MMFDLFTQEEVNLMCIFDIRRRASLTDELDTVLRCFGETEFAEIAKTAIAKLNALNDDEFAALDFYPEYGDYEEV